MSKKTNKLPFILFLPVSIGISLIVSGIVTQRDDLLFAGICVLFGGSFMVGIIVTLLTLALSDKSKTPTEQSDQAPANDVLSEARRRVDEKTGGTSSEVHAALDKIADSVQKRKRKDAVAKFFVILFVVAFIGCALTGVGLMANELLLAGGIVFGCSPLMIVTLLVVVKIKEHISLSDSKKSAENYDRKVGRVIRCTVSSTVSTPTRTTTTYKVEFEVDGKDYTAYSRESYDRGDKLDVAVKRNGKSAKIIGRAEYSFIRDRSTSVKTIGADINESKSRPATDKPSDKPDDGEAEKYVAAIIGSIDRMRGAADIEDEDEGKAAREAAHQAVIDELNKLKAIRAEAEAKRKERMKKPEAKKPPEESTAPEITVAPAPLPTPDDTPVAATEEAAAPLATPAAPHKEEAPRAHTASPHEKRAPVGYKGINRKK